MHHHHRAELAHERLDRCELLPTRSSSASAVRPDERVQRDHVEAPARRRRPRRDLRHHPLRRGLAAQRGPEPAHRAVPELEERVDAEALAGPPGDPGDPPAPDEVVEARQRGHQPHSARRPSARVRPRASSVGPRLPRPRPPRRARPAPARPPRCRCRDTAPRRRDGALPSRRGLVRRAHRRRRWCTPRPASAVAGTPSIAASNSPGVGADVSTSGCCKELVERSGALRARAPTDGEPHRHDGDPPPSDEVGGERGRAVGDDGDDVMASDSVGRGDGTRMLAHEDRRAAGSADPSTAARRATARGRRRTGQSTVPRSVAGEPGRDRGDSRARPDHHVEGREGHAPGRCRRASTGARPCPTRG